MATVKSGLITLFEAGTKVDAKDYSGIVRQVSAVKALGTGDIDDDDEVLMCIVPMNARIKSIKVFNDDLDSDGSPTLATNVGLFYGGGQKLSAGVYPTQGDVIDEDCYASASAALQSANLVGGELLYEANDIANEQQVWEDGGLTEDPGGLAYIGFKISNVAAAAAAGDVKMVVEYIL